jgi:hypothetical protein
MRGLATLARITRGSGTMTKDAKLHTGKAGWEPMLLAKIGRLSDVMQGSSTSKTQDGSNVGSMRMPGG